MAAGAQCPKGKMPIMSSVGRRFGREKGILLCIFFLAVFFKGLTALRPPDYDDNSEEMTYARVSRGSVTPFVIYRPPSPPEKDPRPPSSPDRGQRPPSPSTFFLGPPATTSNLKKQWLAQIMKERYQEFRKKLDQSEETERGAETTVEAVAFQFPLANRAPQPPQAPAPARRPHSQQGATRTPADEHSSFESMKQTEGARIVRPPLAPSSELGPESAKHLRSAEETSPSMRSSGFRPQALPFHHLPRPASSAPFNGSAGLASQRASEAVTHKVLEDRLGPSAPLTFDPSIVVDFFSLLQATRHSQGLPEEEPSLGRGANPPSLSARRQGPVLINTKSSEEGGVTRRRLKESFPTAQDLSSSGKGSQDLSLSDKGTQDWYPSGNEVQNLSLSDKGSQNLSSSDRRSHNASSSDNGPQNASSSDNGPQNASSSDNGPHNASSSDNGSHNASSTDNGAQIPVAKRAHYLQMPSNVGYDSPMKADDLSLYVSMNPGHEKETEAQPEPKSEFGPFSQGDDPNAGLPPSQVSIPDIDLSQIRFPQGVRDSLRKYLKPLISALKPLRESVPGLPGLDYPILSVVPYTNFYCSNMPWPGFYADTEARCQTWHACDVDGRQSTFLCPNGTVFNQMLMVCDWWYNTDCLASPFLYPLNERLFGPLPPDPVTPHTRITPELLDTIFV